MKNSEIETRTAGTGNSARGTGGRSRLSIDRSLTMELVRTVERTAVAAAFHRGRGDEQTADRAAALVMRAELARLSLRGRVVIAEGVEGETPALYYGEELGGGRGPRFDIAVKALENTTACVKNLGDAVTVVAVAEEGTLLQAPLAYMDKIAIGPGHAPGLVDLSASPADNIRALARARGVEPSAITACILDRPRHARLIEEVRSTGAAIRLIADGDVTGVIATTEPERTGVDIYLGSGGAQEGVLAAAALKCLGGQMQGRLMVLNEDQARKARRLRDPDPGRLLTLDDMVAGDVVFAMTGITEGVVLEGVRFRCEGVTTQTLVMKHSTGTARWIKALHRDFSKFSEPAR